MHIENSSIADIDEIFRFYDLAIEFQKKVSDQHWLPCERSLVEKEIAEQRQWKIIIDGRIVFVFCIAWNDPQIWGERDKEPSIYIHRIVTHPDFRGKNFVVEIINWALVYGREKERKFLRMDTWGDNAKLREYYTKCGFKFLGVVKPASPELLPAHYADITLSLFEIVL